MRIGVLDIGSNSAHLRVVDTYPGSPPVPVFRHRAPTRLAEAIDADGRISDAGVRRLVAAVGEAIDDARAHGVAELIPFGTSAVRDATNRDEVLSLLADRVGITLGFLSGEDEGRLTYFAAHRWYGWSSAPLLLLDIGGGSMEVVYGRDEDPEIAVSLPLGAGRLTRNLLPDHPARPKQVRAAREHLRTGLAGIVRVIRGRPPGARVVATSKTFKQLARLAGSRVGKGPYRRSVLRRKDLAAVVPRLAAMSPAARRKLPGVASSRARQILAGALVAESVMTELGVGQLEVCPWALREGILLRRLSPLLTPDSLEQIKLIQAAADPESSALDRRREARREPPEPIGIER
jgi:exopolyphosphatase/guanosine-5'-triphosphate,3'-diphosphate pyrophosphatase